MGGEEKETTANVSIDLSLQEKKNVLKMRRTTMKLQALYYDDSLPLNFEHLDSIENVTYTLMETKPGPFSDNKSRSMLLPLR